MNLFYTGGHFLSTCFLIFVRVFRNVLQYKCSVKIFVCRGTPMIESIVFALVLKKIQIALIACSLVVASALSIYNLPWDGAEWEALTTAVRKLKPSAFKTRWIDRTVGSSVDIESTKCRTVIN